jgi:hypothetical protein
MQRNQSRGLRPPVVRVTEKPLYGALEGLLERVDQLARSAAEDKVDVLRGAGAQPEPELDRDAALDQEPWAVIEPDRLEHADQRHYR